MLKPKPVVDRSFNSSRNSSLSCEIDRLYSESPMARPLLQGYHNTSLDGSIHVVQSANSSVIQKLKPCVQLHDAFEDNNYAPVSVNSRQKPGYYGENSSGKLATGYRMNVSRLNNSYGENTRTSGDECDDDGSVLLDKDTTHEILGALDSHGQKDSFDLDDDAPRIAPAICLTPKFLASRKVPVDDVDSSRALDYNDNVDRSDRVSQLKARLSMVDETEEVEEDQHRDQNGSNNENSGDDDTEDTGVNDGDDEDILVSQPVRTSKQKEYSLSEWTIKPVPSHRCILVEGLLNNLGEQVLWRSTAIVKALDKRTLQTGSGSVYKLIGTMEMECAEKLGFSKTMCTAFKSGFPQNWRALVDKHFGEEEKEENRTSKVQKTTKRSEKSTKNGSRKQKREVGKKGKKAKGDDCVTPSVLEPVDLSMCERTRSGRVVVPSRSVAWWKGVRIYSTPHRPMEIRIETPVANQLDSPLAWPLSTDKKKGQSMFTPPTGISRVGKVRRKPGADENDETVKDTESRLKKGKGAENDDDKAKEPEASTDKQGRRRGKPLRGRRKDKQSDSVEDEDASTVEADATECSYSIAQRQRSKRNETVRLNEKPVDSLSSCSDSENQRSKGRSGRGARQRRTVSSEVDRLALDDPVVKLQRLRTRDTSNGREAENQPELRRSRRGVDRNAASGEGTIERASTRGGRNGNTRVTRSKTQVKESSDVDISRAKYQRQSAESVTSESETESNSSVRPRRRRGPRKNGSNDKKSQKKTELVVDSDDSDTDDEILSARNRIQEKKEVMAQSGNNSGLGLNRSLKRLRGRKNSSLSVSVTDKHGDQQTTSWSDEEVQRFSKALKQISPEVDAYWVKIAELVETKTAEECQAFHLRDVPRSVKKPKVVQKPVPPPKLVRDEDSIRIQLSGGKGTFKRKRQMQTFLDAMNEDFDNDYFNSTPWLNNKRRKVTIPEDIMNDAVTPLPKVGMINTPKTQAALQRLEDGKTPVSNFLSPDTLNNAYNEKDDLYIHRCGRLFRGRINANHSKPGRKATPKTARTNNSDVGKNARMIMELCQSDANDENTVDDDELEDEYFSDAEEN